MMAIALMFLKANWKAIAGGLLVVFLVSYSYARLHEATVLKAEVLKLKTSLGVLQGNYDADQAQLSKLSAKAAKLSESLVEAQSVAQQVRVVTETKVQKILVKGLPVIVTKECAKEAQPLADAAVDALGDIWAKRGSK